MVFRTATPGPLKCPFFLAAFLICPASADSARSLAGIHETDCEAFGFF
jgi:hypothetical protein